MVSLGAYLNTVTITVKIEVISIALIANYEHTSNTLAEFEVTHLVRAQVLMVYIMRSRMIESVL